MSTRRARRRRSSVEVREAILQSAHALFDEYGYQATTTENISERAGVSKRLIFSHFGTKAQLFTAAITAPFARVTAAYVEDWLSDSRGLAPEERVEYLINDLYDLAHKHRIGLITAIAETNSGPSAREDILDELARSFHQILAISSNEQLAGFDIPAMLVIVIGMILGAALLDQLMFPTGTLRPDRQRVINEMRTTLVTGVLNRFGQLAPTPDLPAAQSV